MNNPESHEIDVMCVRVSEPSWIPALVRFSRRVLEVLEYSTWSLSVVLCDDEYIRQLNREYRGKDSATDVLSFPQDDSNSEGGNPEADGGEPFYAGDIVISLNTLAENARYFSVNEEEELKRLLIHGILHLAGWDHSDNSPEQEMLQLQERILQGLSEEKIY
ncbi:rRNA maturation RNase YbeY [Salinispira pacifica]